MFITITKNIVMYSKMDIVEMITRQYNNKQSVIDNVIKNMMLKSDEVIMKSFYTACNLKLDKIGSQYIIVF